MIQITYNTLDSKSKWRQLTTGIKITKEGNNKIVEQKQEK